MTRIQNTSYNSSFPQKVTSSKQTIRWSIRVLNPKKYGLSPTILKALSRKSSEKRTFSATILPQKKHSLLKWLHF